MPRRTRWRRIRWSLTAALALAAPFGLSACTACSEKIVETEPEAVLDVEADKVAARNSWLVQLAKDSAPLVTLADSSPGWGPFFVNDPAKAIEDFQGDAPAVRIGRARAALELAEAHGAIADLVQRLTPDLLTAQKTRPGAEAGAPWRALMRARANGDYSKVPEAGSVGAIKTAVASVDTPLAKLLAGDHTALNAEVPPEATAMWKRRISLSALARAGKLDAALKWVGRVKHRMPDFEVSAGDQTLTFRDPIAARALSVVYAAVAEDAVRDLPGWPSLLRARALVLLDRPGDAIPILEALTKALPAEPPALAQLVLSSTLDVDDLLTETWARLALAAHAANDAARAKAAFDTLAGRSRTVADRVWGAWVAARIGQPVAEGVFPTDRRELLNPLRDEVEALGAAAKGKTDVAQLMLIERYVDVLQRRYGDALVRSDKPALGVKLREAAEEKSANLAPSSRNTVSSLAATARDNMAVGRPRVALKYLSRLADTLPDAHGPAEMLRDLLSLRAMEQGGSATAGH